MRFDATVEWKQDDGLWFEFRCPVCKQIRWNYPLTNLYTGLMEMKRHIWEIHLQKEAEA